jgi:ABC-2 type transport system ATP-binding protein
MNAIDATNVSKHYGSTTALDRVDLTVEEGETFGFLGPNGAGKSTFINILLDFAKPSDGQVEIFGTDCQQSGVEARERIGVLPEGYSVIERLTGRQHIEYAIRSKDAHGTNPLDILDRVGIRDAADRKASGYSKGMAQRLVLGMALVGEPDLLLLDEPSTGLDPNGAAEMRQILREENERGATIFFSSHILEQVEAVCDRVGILQSGELVAVDTIEGLRESMGGGTKLVLTLDELRDSTLAEIETMDGVETVVSQGDSTIEVTCTNDAKMDIVVALHEAGIEVMNFKTEEASLEDMFIEYTGSRGR